MNPDQFMTASEPIAEPAAESNPLKSLRATLNAQMAADSVAVKDTKQDETKPAGTDLATLLKHTLKNSPHLQELASHPDFPVLATDSGVQSLVAALTNQVGKVLTGIKGSGHNPVMTIGD